MSEKELLKTKKWKHIRQMVLKRDKYLCQYYLRFGKNIEASHVHHIYPVEIYPEYAYCMWNLISLSQKAHNMMHVRGSHELTAEGLRLMKSAEEQRRAYDEAMTRPPQRSQ